MASSEGFFDLFNRSPDLYVSAELETGHIIQCNQTLLDRLRRSRESVIAQSIFSVYHPDCHHDVRRALETFRMTGSVLNAELTLVDTDGTAIPVTLDLSSIRDAEGKVIASRSVWRDFTQLREARHEMELLNRDLETRVASRTRELERRNEDLKRFAWLASHDLKTPLRGIRLVASWLREDCYDMIPDASQKYLDQLDQRVDRMENLLRGILEYAQAGRHEPSVKVVCMRTECQRIVESLDCPDSFQVIIEEPMPSLLTDHVPLHRVLQNLIANAVNHRDRDRDDGEVRISHSFVDGVHTFCIADNGPGIDPRFHKKIFEAFQTLRTDDKVEGSGIGLSVVKRIVEDVDCTIHVESQGRGAAFRFTWPATTA